MKIVIEIPEKTNAHIRSDYGHGVKGLRDKDREIVCDAIYHGIPVREKIDNICHIVHSAIFSVFEQSEETPTTAELPSCVLDEEHPHGKWEYDDRSGQFICSECEGGVNMPTLMGEPLYKWCPWCGADMKERE